MLRPEAPDRTGGRRGLVVMALGGLGDQLLLTPFIRHFRQSGGYDRLECVCRPEAKELFDRNPHLDNVICRNGPELFYHGVPRPGCTVFMPFHTVELRLDGEGRLTYALGERLNPGRGRAPVLRQMARASGITLRDERLELFTTASDRATAARLIRTAGPRPVVLLGLTSALAEKNLPTVQRRCLRLALRRAGFALAEVDGRRLRLERQTLPLPGVRVMTEFARRCATIVTVDSFLGHLAACIGKPAVVLFGPAKPSVYGHPINVNLRAGGCPPCGGTPRRKACRAPQCMAAFTVRDIVAHAVALAGARAVLTRRPGSG